MEEDFIVMDEQGKILQLQGRLGGLSRALKKAENKSKRFEEIVDEARKILDGHRKACAFTSGKKECDDTCIAWDSCWEANLYKALKKRVTVL